MKALIYASNIYCSEECCHNALEEGLPTSTEIRRALVLKPGCIDNFLLETLMERATCDCCGINLRDIDGRVLWARRNGGR